MPHPERAAEAILGSDDGLGILRSLVESAAERPRPDGIRRWWAPDDVPDDRRRADPRRRSIAASA